MTRAQFHPASSERIRLFAHSTSRSPRGAPATLGAALNSMHYRADWISGMPMSKFDTGARKSRCH